MRLACVEYAVAAGDKKIIEWVRKGYEYGKAHGDTVDRMVSGGFVWAGECCI